MDVSASAIKANLVKLNLLKAAMGSYLMIPVIVLFFQENGLSLKEIFILQSVFMITLTLWEIPSGYMSDYWGRKKTAVLAGLCYVISVLTYAFSHSYWGFLAGEIILATGVSFYSGTLEALTYDTLLCLKQENRYRQIYGHQMFLHFGAESLGGIIGGLAALISLRFAVWLTVIPFCFALIFSLSLTEPPRHKMDTSNHLKNIWNACANTLFFNASLRGIILIHALISTLAFVLFWSTQPYQTAIGLPLAMFGVTHAIIVAFGALASRFAHSISDRINDLFFLILMAVFLVSCFFFLSFIQALWGLIFFLISRISWGFLGPVTSDIINRLTDSSVRATALSVRGFVSRLVTAAALPIAGFLAERWTLQIMLLQMGIGGLILIAFTFLATFKSYSLTANR